MYGTEGQTQSVSRLPARTCVWQTDRGDRQRRQTQSVSMVPVRTCVLHRQGQTDRGTDAVSVESPSQDMCMTDRIDSPSQDMCMTDRGTDRRRDRQTEGQTDRGTDRRRDRQTQSVSRVPVRTRLCVVRAGREERTKSWGHTYQYYDTDRRNQCDYPQPVLTAYV